MHEAVSLRVFGRNPARELYRRLGFTVRDEADGRITMRADPRSRRRSSRG